MSALLRAGAGLLLLVAVGHSAVAMLGLSRGRNRGELFALDFLIDSGLVSLVVFWASLAPTCEPLTLAARFAQAVLVAWVAATAWRRRGRPLRIHTRAKLPPRPRSGGAWASLVLVASLMLLVATMAHTTLATGLGWDGLAIWGLKAKAIFSEGRVGPGLFHDLSRQWSHLNYPLLLPTVEAWLYYFLGSIDEGRLKVLFIAFQFSLLAMFYGALRRHHVTWYALAFTLVLGSVPALLRNGSYGYADVPLSALVFGSSAFLYSWVEEGRRRDLLMAGILAALAPWMKREGMLFWLIAFGAVVVWSALSRGSSLRERVLGGVTFALPLTLMAPWLVFMVGQELPDNDFAVSVGALISQLPRLPVLAYLLLAQFANVRSWGFVWVLVALAAVWRWRQTSAGERWLLAVVPAYLLPLTASFVFSTWGSYVAHVGASLERLVLHVCPTALLFVALRIGRWGPWVSCPLPRHEAAEAATRGGDSG